MSFDAGQWLLFIGGIAGCALAYVLCGGSIFFAGMGGRDKSTWAMQIIGILAGCSGVILVVSSFVTGHSNSMDRQAYHDLQVQQFKVQSLNRDNRSVMLFGPDGCLVSETLRQDDGVYRLIRDKHYLSPTDITC